MSSIHAEVGAAVGDELVDLFEAALVEQEQDALAGGELAFAVLAIAALRASALFGESVAAVEFEEGIGGGWDSRFGHRDGL